MFSLGHSNENYIDPSRDREPPPLPTVVVFPTHESLQPDKSWPQNPPDLIKQYTNVNKPYDLRSEHLKVLNIDTCNDVPLEDFIPASSDGLRHLPPREWGKDPVGREVVPGTASRRNSAASYEIFAHDKYPLLSNGVHAPNEETYVKFAAELVCDTDDGLRVVQRQKPHPGHKAPVLSQYRKFWGVLDTMSAYWDSSMDTYFESKTRPVPVRTASGTKLFRGLLSGHTHQHKDAAVSIPATQSATKRYRGRRTDTGSNMPDHIRSDCIRNFIDPVASAFGCQTAVPRKSPQVKVKNMLVPVTQTIAVWRNPQDKSQAKGGYLEGPVLGVSSRGSTNFIANDTAATVDTAREIGGLLLLAQERHREGRNKTVPGQGKWYTTKPRWGGGPGGEFGSGEKNANGAASSTKSASSSASAGHPVSIKWRPSDEFIWKQLKAQPGLWEIGKTYLAIGKERGSQYDDVFMISSLYHHISFVKLNVHPLYLEWLEEGTLPASPPDSKWSTPTLSRTRWYDLFNPDDRAEAMRGLWGMFSYMMRAGPTARRPVLGERQRSEVAHRFAFRKKQPEVVIEFDDDPPRSQSLY